MANIDGYQLQQRDILVYPEIWDDKKKTLKPIKSMAELDLHEVLDSITLAVEAGALDNYKWPQQIFAKKSAFEDFIEQLSEYDDFYRITDRWWWALATICEGGDEEGFVSSSEIARELLVKAMEDGKLDNFGKKSPSHKFSVEECIAASLSISRDCGSGYNLLSQDERVKAQDISSYGRYYTQRATKAEHTAAYQEGVVLEKQKRAAEKAASKKTTTRKAGKQHA
ncbi:hypothetical protein [Rhodoferax saidenbachensis]|uniref:Tail assembly chaperone n=1 Tax=Rhodoferax saidenbachensis TaxID=1484693 RepID=A0ABU1ZSP6_9BURK|nr:hypothetical protein [Rhodoferax saidenbachensis]MDR7307946.1 hypothetical protein [Rhodoferax saidenbachensis]